MSRDLQYYCGTTFVQLLMRALKDLVLHQCCCLHVGYVWCAICKLFHIL